MRVCWTTVSCSPSIEGDRELDRRLRRWISGTPEVSWPQHRLLPRPHQAHQADLPSSASQASFPGKGAARPGNRARSVIRAPLSQGCVLAPAGCPPKPSNETSAGA